MRQQKGNLIRPVCPVRVREYRYMKSVCILTCDWAPVIVSGDPGEANAAGCWVWQIQIYGGVWTVCRETGNNLTLDMANTYRTVQAHM